jgi:hypothetical protein
MVFGNVPKLHGLIAILAGVIAVPTGCSGADFSGCKASRTCPPAGGSSGEGGDGDTGGTDRGGTSSGAGGTRGGAAGTGGTDEGGNGGAPDPDDRERPTIVSFSPDDGDVDVERDVTATVTFSEALDAESVNETSVVLTGPDGDVAGTASVDGDVVTFVAEKPLYLLGEYTLTLGETIADLAGNTLGDEASVGFRVRDGRWSPITTPFGRTARYMSAFTHNSLGDMLIAGTQPTDREPTLWAAIYSVSDNRWTPADTVTPGPPEVFGPSWQVLGIDAAGRAAFAWITNAGSNGYGWYRYSEPDGWVSAGTLPGSPTVAVTPGGRATAAWRDGTSVLARSIDLATGAVGSISPVRPGSDSYLRSTASVERVALFGIAMGGGGWEISVTWQSESGMWGPREPLTSEADIPYWLVESDESGNIALLWLKGEKEIWSRFYQRDVDTWTRPQLVAAGASAATMGFPRVGAGNVALPLYLDREAYGAFYQRGIGWIQSSIVELDLLGDFEFASGAFGVEMAMDPRGNALAVGTTGYRRYQPATGWQSVVTHGLDLGPWRLWLAAAADGSVTAVTHDSTPNDDLIPKVMRFE